MLRKIEIHISSSFGNISSNTVKSAVDKISAIDPHCRKMFPTGRIGNSKVVYLLSSLSYSELNEELTNWKNKYDHITFIVNIKK